MTSLFCKKYLSDYKSLEGLLLCQLIPFNKSPGIKPIRKRGSFEMNHVENSYTYNQERCASSRITISLHRPKSRCWASSTSHGRSIPMCWVQIDSANAFNSLNRNFFLHNIKIICPEIVKFISNCYKHSKRYHQDYLLEEVSKLNHKKEQHKVILL